MLVITFSEANIKVIVLGDDSFYLMKVDSYKLLKPRDLNGIIHSHVWHKLRPYYVKSENRDSIEPGMMVNVPYEILVEVFTAMINCRKKDYQKKDGQ